MGKSSKVFRESRQNILGLRGLHPTQKRKENRIMAEIYCCNPNIGWQVNPYRGHLKITCRECGYTIQYDVRKHVSLATR